jgi:TPM domain
MEQRMPDQHIPHIPHMPNWQRWWRHLWLDTDDVRRTLPSAVLQRLETHVQRSETRHRGELRLCVEGGLGWAGLRADVHTHARAVALFSQLRVWDTEHNNGVLIYLCLAERRIEILADRGISSQVDPAVWQAMVQSLSGHFKLGNFEAGLMETIDQVGQWMKQLYPVCDRHPDNPNELPNAVVIL